LFCFWQGSRMKTPMQFVDEMEMLEQYSRENDCTLIESGCWIMAEMLDELGYDDGVSMFRDAVGM
jgi:hypothetical protein